LLGRPAEAGGNLLLVAHGGLYTAMLPHILINIDYPFAQTQGFPNTGVVIAEPTPAGLTCLSWCGVTPGQPAG
jgi:broad specificity phosphatase PhoE